jgi:hypothetical protein
VVSVSLGLVVGVYYDDIAAKTRMLLAGVEAPWATQLSTFLSPDTATDKTSDHAPTNASSPPTAHDGDAAETAPETGQAQSPAIEPARSVDGEVATPPTAVAGGDVALAAYRDVIEEIPTGGAPEVATPTASVHREGLPASTTKTASDVDTVSSVAATAAETSTTTEESPAEAGESATERVVPLNELPVRKKVRQMVTRAEGLIKSSRYDDAVLLLQRAELVDASYPLLHRTRGIAEASRGKTDAARSAYRRYLKLAPNAPDAADVRRILGE